MTIGGGQRDAPGIARLQDTTAAMRVGLQHRLVITTELTKPVFGRLLEATDESNDARRTAIGQCHRFEI